MSNAINSQALKRLREARGLTQEQLAERCNCTKDTVSRWERGQTSRVRAHLREPLCKALGTQWEALTKPPQMEPMPRDDLVQISARIRPETRNALQAVCERYNVDQRIVLEYAPLLFLIAAEKSLKARRETLDQIEAEIWGGYDAMRDRTPYLGSYAPNFEATEVIDEERKAISKRNLSRKGCYLFDDEKFDPFVNFLEAQVIDLPKGAVEYIAPSFAGYADYEIATDTVNQLLALDLSPTSEESNKVRQAIASGQVELRTAISQKSKLTEHEFQTWLDDALAEAQTDLDREIGELLDGIDLGIIDKNAVLKALKKANDEEER